MVFVSRALLGFLYSTLSVLMGFILNSLAEASMISFLLSFYLPFQPALLA